MYLDSSDSLYKRVQAWAVVTSQQSRTSIARASLAKPPNVDSYMSSLHANSSINESTFAPSDDVVHSGEAWSSSASKDPWDPCILALDGGGIRGYSSLLIVKALMHQVFECEQRLADGTDADLPDSAHEDELLPAHYFDYMYGTSTGGLIAVMLARLRMTVPQCLEIYRDVGDRLFGRQRSRIPLTTKYHHQPLEHAVRNIVQRHCKQHMAPDQPCDGDDWFPWEYAIPHYREAEYNNNVDYDHHLCQAICLTSVHNGRIDEAHLMRTYNHEYDQIPNWINPYNAGADKLRIWQVTRATSAAPFYFDWLEAELEGESWRFKDGGIRENNPAGAAWSEFVSRYGEHQDPALLLSIGTGRPDESKDGFATAWPGPFGRSSIVKKFAEKLAVLRNVLIKYTDGEQKHRDMINTARGEHTWYKRLNVDQGLEGMPLDDWKKGLWEDATGVTREVPGGATLTRMQGYTEAYLDRPYDRNLDTYAAPSTMLVQAAEKLVRQRRARAGTRRKNPVRWDTYMGRYLTGRPSATVPDEPLEREALVVDEGRRRWSVISSTATSK